MYWYLAQIQDKHDKIWEYVYAEKSIKDARKTAKRQCEEGDKIVCISRYKIKK